MRPAVSDVPLMVESGDQDREDVDRVLSGNAEAFAGIVSRWQRPLKNLAYRFCRDHGYAEEMAQEAFLRAFQHLHQWRHDAAFSTWLFALALNCYRTATRRQKAYRPISLEHVRELVASGDVHADVAVGQRDDLIRRMVTTLPDRYRDALILFYFLDQNVADAANVLGIPAGTFKARLHRGRELLRRRLSRRDGEWRI
jgi:RNA polymerase sigma-70 factor (ECF subfamily)